MKLGGEGARKLKLVLPLLASYGNFKTLGVANFLVDIEDFISRSTIFLITKLTHIPIKDNRFPETSCFHHFPLVWQVIVSLSTWTREITSASERSICIVRIRQSFDPCGQTVLIPSTLPVTVLA